MQGNLCSNTTGGFYIDFIRHDYCQIDITTGIGTPPHIGAEQEHTALQTRSFARRHLLNFGFRVRGQPQRVFSSVANYAHSPPTYPRPVIANVLPALRADSKYSPFMTKAFMPAPRIFIKSAYGFPVFFQFADGRLHLHNWVQLGVLMVVCFI